MTDDFGATATQLVTITITGTNDSPVAVADTGAVLEDATLTVSAANGVIRGTTGGSVADTDVDNATNTLVVSGVVAGAGAVTQGVGVGSSLAGTYGHLTLNADGSYSYVADTANSLAAGVTAVDTFTYTDKDPFNAVSNTTTLQITVTGTNDAPTVTAGAQSVQLVEAGVGTAGTASASITLTKGDVDAGDTAVYDGTALTSNGWSTGNGGVTYTKTGTYGIATLTTGTGIVSYALDNADTDTNALAGGAGVSDNFTVFVKDGSTGTASTAVNFAITGTNDNPTVTAGAQSVQLVEAGVATAGTASASIALTKGDVDAGDAAVYDGTALTSNGWATGNGGVTYTKTGTYGIATLTTGTGVVSYALDNADTDTNGLAQGAGVSDNFTVFVKDGTTGTASTAVNFAITGTNDAPVLDLDANNSSLKTGADYQATFTENGSAVAVADTDVSITDADNTNVTSATITLTNAQASDLLAVNGGLPAGIVASSYNSGTGVLTLTGSATLAAYQTALHQIVFSNSSGSPNTTDRSITVVVNDGSANSNTATSTIHVTAVNNAPVLDLDLNNSSLKTGADYQATFTENGSAVAVADTDVSITDADNTNVTSATITLTNAQASDLLAVNGGLPAGITASSYNSGTGVLTLTGSATLAAYQTALHQIVFSNASENPNMTDRSITVVVNDGSTNSNTATATIHVTAVNDAPVGVADTYAVQSGNSISAATVVPVLANDTDVDNGTLTAVLDSGPAHASAFSLNADGTFNYTPAAGFVGGDTFTYHAFDGSASSNVVTVSIVVTAPDGSVNGRVIDLGNGADTASFASATFNNTGGNWSIYGGNGKDDITTSSSHIGGSTSYFGDTVGNSGIPGHNQDHIVLLFTSNQLEEILSDTTNRGLDPGGTGTFETELQNYLDGNVDGGSLTTQKLDLSASSWAATVAGFGEAELAIRAANGAVIKYTAIGTTEANLPDLFTTNLTGNSADNTIVGTSNGDTIGTNVAGNGDGNDILVGLGGDDSLLGGAGSDLLLGGANNDTLTGGTGADILSGGTGADVFAYTATAQSSGANIDTIIDFTAGIDKIKLSTLIDANSVAGGTQNFTTVTNTSTPLAAQNNNVWWFYNAATDETIIRADTNGSVASAELEIHLSGNIALTATDFVLNTAPAGVAGSSINLGLPALPLADGQSASILVKGVPSGWTLDGGTDNGDGSWTMQTSDVKSLTVTSPTDFAGAITLNIIETWTGADGNTLTQFVSDNVEAYASGSPVFAWSGDDVLTGSSGNDLFVFSQPIGNDTVHSFDAAADKIDLIGYSGFASFADVQAHMADDANGSAVITLGDGQSIMLDGVHSSALTGSNFVFDQTPVVNNTGTMTIGDGAMLPLSGTINNTGLISLDSTSSDTLLQVIQNGITLQGGGQVVLSDSAANVVSGTAADVTLTNVDNTISGAGQLGGGSLSVNNLGTIIATGTHALVIDTGGSTVVNSGTLEATGSGGLEINGAVANTGLIWANGGDIEIGGQVTGDGDAIIGNMSQLEFHAASSADVIFEADAAGTLRLDDSFDFSGSIAGITNDDKVDLGDIWFSTGTSAVYHANQDGSGGTLTVSDGIHDATLHLLGAYDADNFTVADDGIGGTVVAYNPADDFHFV
ncbi:beta strand repeat-containing protein [Mesorhizobium australicum]|uniref:beta strand repeat-containing protein n=1 Tax=Mesorhizobium australicum TaxID=536018 RepID=UPI0033353767